MSASSRGFACPSNSIAPNVEEQFAPGSHRREEDTVSRLHTSDSRSEGRRPGLRSSRGRVDPGKSTGRDDAVERRPCPACGELIAVKAKKCRFCGEEFDGRSRRKEFRELRGKYNSQMNGLGGLWIFLGCLALLAVIAISCFEPPPGMQKTPAVLLVVGIITLGWFVAGIGTCLKQRWAVYVGLTLSYLNGIGSLVTLANCCNQNVAQSGLAAQSVIGMLLMTVGILQGHRVNGMAKRLNAREEE